MLGCSAPSASARSAPRPARSSPSTSARSTRLMAATEEELQSIPDIGAVTALFIREWFSLEQSQHQIRLLREAGVSFESAERVLDDRFRGMTFVLTGTLPTYTRGRGRRPHRGARGRDVGQRLKKDEHSPRRRKRRQQAHKGPGARHKGHRRDEFRAMPRVRAAYINRPRGG